MTLLPTFQRYCIRCILSIVFSNTTRNTLSRGFPLIFNQILFLVQYQAQLYLQLLTAVENPLRDVSSTLLSVTSSDVFPVYLQYHLHYHQSLHCPLRIAETKKMQRLILK